MTDQPAYTEYRADPSGLRQRPGERLRSGNFEYPTYPFQAPAELRDVRGVDRPGKEPDSGTFKIYVGSANDRTSLGKLSEKLSLVFYKKERLFQNARIVRVERDASPGSKEASDER